MRRALLACVLSGIGACGRGNAERGAAPDAMQAAASAAVASASAATTTETAASVAPIEWRGTYKSEPGTLYIPPELKVSWKPSETSAGIGEGTISLSVDHGSGRVRGDLDGPLGPAALTGLAAEGKVTATIVRKDPKDRGFAGTMIGTLGTERGEGTLNVSLPEGGAIRSATFVLSSRGPSR
jgi:hypothetical protein